MPQDVWGWIESIVVPGLYHTMDYRGMVLKDYESKFINNMNSMRLGPPRLRQIRVNTGNITPM